MSARRPAGLVALLAALAAVGAVLGAPVPAGAQYPPADEALAVSDTSPEPGQEILVTGAGFMPGSTVDIYFESAPVLLARAPVGPDGRFAVRVRIPADATPGHHLIRVKGIGADGRPRELTIPVFVSGPAAGGRPPSASRPSGAARLRPEGATAPLDAAAPRPGAAVPRLEDTGPLLGGGRQPGTPSPPLEEAGSPWTRVLPVAAALAAVALAAALLLAARRRRRAGERPAPPSPAEQRPPPVPVPARAGSVVEGGVGGLARQDPDRAIRGKATEDAPAGEARATEVTELIERGRGGRQDEPTTAGPPASPGEDGEQER